MQASDSQRGGAIIGVLIALATLLAMAGVVSQLAKGRSVMLEYARSQGEVAGRSRREKSQGEVASSKRASRFP